MEPCYKTFVSIGNAKQSFKRLLDAVTANIDLLPTPVLIQAGHTAYVHDGCTIIDFINMDTFVEHMIAADIVILHAGAGSVLHAIRSGKMPIVMPRTGRLNEHINDHQVAFASILDKENRIKMVENTEQLRQAIIDVKKLPKGHMIKTNASRAINTIANKLTEIFS